VLLQAPAQSVQLASLLGTASASHSTGSCNLSLAQVTVLNVIKLQGSVCNVHRIVLEAKKIPHLVRNATTLSALSETQQFVWPSHHHQIEWCQSLARLTSWLTGEVGVLLEL
jgi:hypothetical protein